MLTLVPTPIGNLQDITLRALIALREADIILCEDTRITKKLYHLLLEKGMFKMLDFKDSTESSEHRDEDKQVTLKAKDKNSALYSIDSVSVDSIRAKTFLPLHSHNQEVFIENLTSNFFAKNVVYVSDAGMPTISDPGALLVKFCIDKKLDFDVLPGVSAFSVNMASSGIECKNFYFGGFLPHKTQEKENEIITKIALQIPCIWYEAPTRLIQTLQSVQKLAPNSYLCLCKEISKLYQERFFGSPSEVLTTLQEKKILGEWSILIFEKHINKTLTLGLQDILNLNFPPKEKAKLLSKINGKNTKENYTFVLESQKI